MRPTLERDAPGAVYALASSDDARAVSMAAFMRGVGGGCARRLRPASLRVTVDPGR